ncbi:MAG: pseudouridine synthase [Blastocatellia bacterium]|nr:pseudouridine synthase [Blastocatellia bacterium]
MKPLLPVIDGVTASSKRLPWGTWKTLLDFLVEQFPNVGRETWVARMEKGAVCDERGNPFRPGSPYHAGGTVFYYREPETEPPIPFTETILYQDEHLLAVDKPHFLPVVPAGPFLQETLLIRLRRKGFPASLTPLHRLDRETAGVVLFSLQDSTRGLLTRLFQDRAIRKTYHALAPGRSELVFPLIRRSRIVVGEPFFRMQETAGEPNSETKLEILSASGKHNLYQVIPTTGKKHQIRVHFAALGIPILNDRFYPELEEKKDDDFSAPLRLLAKKVEFTHPVTGRDCVFESLLSLSEGNLPTS